MKRRVKVNTPKYLQPKYKEARDRTLGEKVRKIMQGTPGISANQIREAIGYSSYDINFYYSYFRRHGLEAEL